jgi:hypothetical protein
MAALVDGCEEPIIKYMLHYCGHSTMSHLMMDSGWWVCADGQFIKIEDILIAINTAAKAKKKSVDLRIFADCPGAAGIFHRATRVAHIENCSNIESIMFECVCDFNEMAFGNED